MTKPNHESIAADNLKNQGYEHYCPRFAQRQGTVTRVKPLFPRYIFVSLGQSNQWTPIKSTRGVSYVLAGADERPQRVRAADIETLKKRERNGLVQLPQEGRFMPGEKVKVENGPLAGQLLLYEGMSAAERCYVLVGMFERSVRVEVAEKLLVAA